MDMLSDITAFDAIVVVLLGFSAIIGFTRGFTTEVLTLFAWAGAVFAVLYGMSLGGADFARSIISPDFLADIIAAVALFLGGLILFKWIAGKIGDGIKKSHVGALDRSLGALFGVIRGLLVLAGLYLFLSYFVADDRQPDWIANAKTKPLVSYSAEMLALIVPGFADMAETEAETRSLLEIMEENMPAASDLDVDGDAIVDQARDQIGDMIEGSDDADTEESDPDDGN